MIIITVIKSIKDRSVVFVPRLVIRGLALLNKLRWRQFLNAQLFRAKTESVDERKSVLRRN